MTEYFNLYSCFIFFFQIIIFCISICLQIEQDWNDVFGNIFFLHLLNCFLFQKKKVNLYMAWFYRLASLSLTDYIFSLFSLFLCEVHLSHFWYTFLTCDLCRKHAKYVLSNLLTACLLKLFIREISSIYHFMTVYCVSIWCKWLLVGQLYFWLYLNNTLKDIMFIKEQGDTWKYVDISINKTKVKKSY